MLSRRGLIGSLISLAAAPAIVRASSLMPIKAMLSDAELLQLRLNAAYAVARENMNRQLYGDLVDITRKAFAPRLFVQLYRSPTVYGELFDGR